MLDPARREALDQPSSFGEVLHGIDGEYGAPVVVDGDDVGQQVGGTRQNGRNNLVADAFWCLVPQQESVGRRIPNANTHLDVALIVAFLQDFQIPITRHGRAVALSGSVVLPLHVGGVGDIFNDCSDVDWEEATHITEHR